MEKKIIYIFIAVFGTLGAYLPVLFGQSALGGWSILAGFIGSILGLVVGIKTNNYIE